jgi:hypothetical protein
MDVSKRMDEVRPGVNFLLGLLTGAAIVAIVTLIVYIGFGLPARGPRIEDVETETLPPGSIATSKLERIEGGRFGGRRLVLGIPRGEACPACLSIQLGGQSDKKSFKPSSVTSDGESIWVGVQEGSVVRINPSNGEVVQEVKLAKSDGKAVTDMVVAGEYIWALAGGQAYRVDTRTNEITQTHPISPTVNGTQIAFDGKKIWVIGPEGSVFRINPGNGTVEQEVTLANSAKALDLAWDGTYVWVLDTEGCLTRIRASDSQVDTHQFNCEKARVDEDSRIFYEASYIWVTLLDGVLYRR